MLNWQEQLHFEDVSAGIDIPPVTIPITLQRLVMEAGANRDFSLIHHDRDVARATGASDAYANTFFLAGMFERLLREWMGLGGRIRKISSLRMSSFNVVGDTVTFGGKVRECDAEKAEVTIEMRASTDAGTTVTAKATVVLPRK